MDNKHEILALLRSVASGQTAPEDALLELKTEPFADLGYAKVDFHRGVRQGAAEVIYGASKTAEQILGIVQAMEARDCRNILITRMDREKAEFVAASVALDYHADARLGIALPSPQPTLGSIVVCTGGTSDQNVPYRLPVSAPLSPAANAGMENASTRSAAIARVSNSFLRFPFIKPSISCTVTCPERNRPKHAGGNAGFFGIRLSLPPAGKQIKSRFRENNPRKRHGPLRFRSTTALRLRASPQDSTPRSGFPFVSAKRRAGGLAPPGRICF